MFLSRPCPGCGDHRWYPCRRCINSLVRAPALHVPGARSSRACALYDGVAVRFVAEAKEPAGRRFVRWWADAIAAAAPDDLDLVTWVPASAPGRQQRGHDQAAVLAAAVGARLGRPAVRCLRRTSQRHQTGLDRADRRRVRFEATSRARDRTVLVVDDVHTTGSSLAAAVDELLQVGAVAVDVSVLAVVERRAARP